MRPFFRHLLSAAALVATGTSAAQAQGTAYALTTTQQGNQAAVQQLIRFNPSAPGSFTTVGVTGVTLSGIDFRPLNNVLYGYAGTTLFTINLQTGAATAIPGTFGSASGNVGFDFNPTVDRIRVVSPTGTNLRLVPDGNMAMPTTSVDGPYTLPASLGGGSPVFSAVAYTNNDNDPATGTMLFGIDASRGQLFRMGSPNGGEVTLIGNLGISNLSSVLGFDILTIGTANTAFFTANTNASSSGFYSLDLATGAATLVDRFGGQTQITGLAITAVPEPGTYFLVAVGLAGVGLVARRRRNVAA